MLRRRWTRSSCASCTYACARRTAEYGRRMDQGRCEGGRLPAPRRRARARTRTGRGGDDGGPRRPPPRARQGGFPRRGVAGAALSGKTQRRLERFYRRSERLVVAFRQGLGGDPREEQAL